MEFWKWIDRFFGLKQRECRSIGVISHDDEDDYEPTEIPVPSIMSGRTNFASIITVRNFSTKEKISTTVNESGEFIIDLINFKKGFKPGDNILIQGLRKTQGGERTVVKREVVFKARVAEITRSRIRFEFGRTQMNMDMSGSGLAARKLKLQKGTKVSVSLKALGK